jgi:hypothetical protein
VGTAALNLNPIFAIWPTTTFPTNWQDWTNGVANTSKVTGPISPYAVQINGVAGSDTGIGSSTSFSLTPNGWYVIEADIELVSGALTAAGVWVSLSDSSGAYIGDVAINFATDPDIAGATNGAGVAGTSYKYRKLVQVTPSTTSSGNIYAMAHSSALGSTTAANSIQFQRVDIRPASSAEILANTVNVNVNALSATVTTQAGAIATLDGRTAAYLEFSASTSGGTALFILDSTSYGTSVALSGDHIYLGDGITVTPSATDPTIQYVGTSYQLVTGLNFGASSNLLEWYGPVGIAISAMTTANALQYIDNGGNTTGGTKTFVQSTDPAGSNTVANGSFWYDDASGVFYLRAGGAWQAVGGQIADGAVVFTGGSGSGTYTVPLNAPGYVTVTITGGHGGAGEVQTSGPWLGGGGGTATYHFAVTPGSTTISYSLGNNGANSNTGNGAGGGGSTCTSSAFSGTMIANGGAGGTPANTSAGGTASGPSGGTYTTGGTSAGIPGPSITITAHTT